MPHMSFPLSQICKNFDIQYHMMSIVQVRLSVPRAFRKKFAGKIFSQTSRFKHTKRIIHKAFVLAQISIKRI